MAYTPHTLVAFGGRLGVTVGSQDQWQCGIRIASRAVAPGASNGPLANPAAYLAAIATPLRNWYLTASSSTAGSEFKAMRSDAYLDYVKVNNINALGHYTDQNVSNTFTYATTQGALATPSLLPYTTAAISWLTPFARGRAHRGRIYLPLALSPSSDGKLSSVEQTQCNKTGKALLALLSTPTDGGLAVGCFIASKIDGSLNLISAVSTGNVFDVQRRRKEQIPETYSTIAFP